MIRSISKTKYALCLTTSYFIVMLCKHYTFCIILGMINKQINNNNNDNFIIDSK